jgi:signal transduction histidine kinase
MILIGSAIVVLAAAMYATKRIRDLALENRRLRGQTQEVVQMKKDFISYVSHELKAPLASMQETTQLLLERIPGSLTEKQTRLLELNLQSGKRLGRMLGNMLDVSRLEAGIVDYDMDDRDLAEIVRRAVEEHNAGIGDGLISVRAALPDQPVMSCCDCSLILLLLDKVLENATYASGKRCAVQVIMTLHDRAPAGMPAGFLEKTQRGANPAGFVLISIVDSGPGIEDSQKERVFEVFHHVGHGGQRSNLGLGLSIARMLAEGHGGAIWVEDNPRGGSIFQILLPRSTAQPRALRQAS